MGRFLLGLVTGVVLVLVGHGVLFGKINFWRYMGQLDGRDDIFAFVEGEFGVTDATTRMVPNTGQFSHKCSLLVAVEVNGVKTIRVLP